MPNRFVFGNENGAASASASASSGGGPTMMYEFKDTTAPLQDHPSRRGHARNRGGGSQGSHSSTYGGSGGGGDDDGTAGSLSYSVASSVTGESTDSSFAEIMRVLESSDNDNNASSKELSHHLKKQQLQQAQHQNITTGQSLSQHRFAFGGDEKSVAADSLAYSAKSSSVASENSLAYSIDAAETYMRSLAADGEASHLSHLQGSALVSAGQRSSQSGGYDGNPGASALGASYVNNGGGQGHDVNENDGNMYMMFSPAEHSDSLKLRKEKKRQERRQQQQQQSSGSPRDVKDVRLILPDAKKVGIRPYLNPDNGDTAWDTSGNNKNKNNLNARIVSPSPWTDEYRNGDSSAYDTREQTPRGASRSTTATRQETPTTPSAKNRPPRHESNVSDDQCFQFHDDDNNDAWYANWWSVCFPDAVAQTVVERPK